MVPNDHDIGSAVSIDARAEFCPARSAGHEIHSVADLKRLTEGRACGYGIDADGTPEHLDGALDKRPKEALRGIEIRERSVGRIDTIVVRCPPDFAGARVLVLNAIARRITVDVRAEAD